MLTTDELARKANEVLARARAETDQSIRSDLYDLAIGYLLLAEQAAQRDTVKLIADYVELATKFEGLAANESNPEFKAQLAKQAAAYRKLASEQAERVGVPPPELPNQK